MHKKGFENRGYVLLDVGISLGMHCVRCRNGHWHTAWGHAAIGRQIYNHSFATNTKNPINEMELRGPEEQTSCFGIMCMLHNNHV